MCVNIALDSVDSAGILLGQLRSIFMPYLFLLLGFNQARGTKTLASGLLLKDFSRSSLSQQRMHTRLYSLSVTMCGQHEMN